MHRKLVITATATLVLAALGLLAWLAADVDSGPARGAAVASERKPERAAEPAFPPSPSAAAAGSATLTPAELKAIQEGLERAASEAGQAALRQAFQEGVEQPWPLPRALDVYRGCLVRAEGIVRRGGVDGLEQQCACAIRAIQRSYPDGPPPEAPRNPRRAFDRAVGEAVESCAGR